MDHLPPAEPMRVAQGLRTNQQLLQLQARKQQLSREVLGAGTQGPGSDHNSRTPDQQTAITSHVTLSMSPLLSATSWGGCKNGVGAPY